MNTKQQIKYEIDVKMKNTIKNSESKLNT